MNCKSTFTWKFQTCLKLRLFFNCREVLKIFVCSHEHFILGVWTLVNLNRPIKFLQSFISFRVENSLQVKMCSHAISHWFEISLLSIWLKWNTKVNSNPKWSKVHENADREHTTHRSELRPVWFHFGSHVNVL